MKSATTGPTNKPRTAFRYRCRICGWSCAKEIIPGVNVSVTKLGDYGTRGTAEGVEYADEMYEATTISFTAASGSTPAYLSDSANRFGEKRMTGGLNIRIGTTSGTNDGDYTIAARGLSRGGLLLDSSDSLTTEDAATAGTVTISRIIYRPNTTQGCPGCGSLNSR